MPPDGDEKEFNWKMYDILCKVAATLVFLSILVGLALLLSPYIGHTTKYVVLGWFAILGLVVLYMYITSIIFWIRVFLDKS